MTIRRVSLFKLKDVANAPEMMKNYQKIGETSTRDGKPYILSLFVRPNLGPVERGHGFNFVGITRFATLDDLRYYDEECKVHANFREQAVELCSELPPLTVWVEEDEE